jgi:hypothetical protein
LLDGVSKKQQQEHFSWLSDVEKDDYKNGAALRTAVKS